jgi:hypothetical protein
MDNAMLAVIGTLAGVVTTAVFSLIGIWLTSQNQRMTAEQQFKNSTIDKLRGERRSACIEYLSAYSNFREALLSAHQQRLAMSTTSTRTPKPVEYAPEAAAQFSRAHHTLQITFDNPITDLARRCTRDIWELADNFSAETNNFDRMWSVARSSRRELQDAMRANLYSGV